ncbi:hypothetical protein RQP46_003253 [Phenoliferia psychrophenolica]
MSMQLIPTVRATLPRASRAPIASRQLRVAPRPSSSASGARLASTSSYYRGQAEPDEKKGFKIGNLFLALAATGIVATSIGLYQFYSSFTAFPNTTSHPIRTLLRRGLTASSNGDHSRAATAFEAAYALALDLAAKNELGSPDAALLKTTGIMVTCGSMWEQVGQLSKARDAYSAAWNEVVQRIATGAATTDETMRGVAVALKIGDLYVEENADAQAEPFFVWSVESMMRLGMSDSQKQKVQEELLHDAVPAKAEAAEKGKASDDGWDLPKWLGKVELVAGFERLGDLYTRTGKPEYAQPLLQQAITTLLPPPPKDGPQPPGPAPFVPIPTRCHAATLMNNLSSTFVTAPSPNAPAIEQASRWARQALLVSAQCRKEADKSRKGATVALEDREDVECEMVAAVSCYNLGKLSELSGDKKSAKAWFEKSAKQIRMQPSPLSQTHSSPDSDDSGDEELPTKLGQLAIAEVEIDVESLNPLSPEVISKQATINIGTIGHVAHGKSQTVKAISGVQTVRFKNELERNITIKLGYANAKIYKCEKESCARPGCYKSYSSDKEDSPACLVAGCGGTMKLLRHVSFVDCPGHDILMATMLNGAAVMDAALLLIAANEPCPQPQTSEHLAAIEIMKLKHILVLQNKVDLIREAAADEHHQSILAFVKGTVADSAPIIPISAQLRYNIDALVEYIVTKIPVPVRDFQTSPKLIVIRSFDVNKPGAEVQDLKGGVAGGSLLKGVLRLGQEIEVRPGVVSKDSEGKITCKPIRSKIITLLAEKNELKFAVPGGLIGVGTLIDPQLTRGDRLVGQVLGSKGSLPSIYVEIEIQYFLLRRLLGVKTDDKKQTKVQKLAKNEILMVNIGSTSEGGRVVSVKADLAKILLNTPAATELGEKVALSRRIDKHWRLIGWGSVRRGTEFELPENY